ncbi:MAG: valine--tRNA ligase, partial [Clostridia bacterium]|nr:valine--tRNA ligase [Clostridia bacterium]
PYAHNVGTCYRCHTTIEPMVSKQWFVAIKTLAEPALRAVEDGTIKFVPERYVQTYYNWMRNIRDWCISRQLWWGHRIPAWYCEDCGATVVEETEPVCCPHCGGKLTQDEDVLDTWFSSGMWPFSTLGWPEKTEELKYYYPTSTLATGYDLIFFWIARMIMFGLYAMDEIPFHTVFLHGMVRDEIGRKMSKSLGNGIDPLEIIKEYGADSLRFALTSGTAAGTDMRYSQKKVEAARNFCNKVYNASRFVLMNLGDTELGGIDRSMLDIADKWILHRLNEVVRDTTGNIDSFDLNLAVDKVYSFIWTEFCDWYIEMAKPRLYGDDEAAKRNVLSILVHVLSNSLKLLHPFMPFITEDIYQRLPGSEKTIMLSAWPKFDETLLFPEEADAMEQLMDMVRQIRNVRAEMNVPPSKRAHTTVVTAPENEDICRQAAAYLNKLAGASTVDVRFSKEGIDKNAVSVVSRLGEAFIPMKELIDVEKELERLDKEVKRWEGEAARASGKLGNPGFMAKAPEKVVADERAKLENAQEMLKKLAARLADLKG